MKFLWGFPSSAAYIRIQKLFSLAMPCLFSPMELRAQELAAEPRVALSIAHVVTVGVLSP